MFMLSAGTGHFLPALAKYLNNKDLSVFQCRHNFISWH